jgi:hypothetical protein
LPAVGRDQARADPLGAAGDDGGLLAWLVHGDPVSAVAEWRYSARSYAGLITRWANGWFAGNLTALVMIARKSILAGLLDHLAPDRGCDICYCHHEFFGAPAREDTPWRWKKTPQGGGE